MAKPKNLILSSTVFERVVHWVLAGSCLFLFLTGFGLMFHSLSFIANFFPGGFYVMKLLHNIDGIIFGLAFLFALVAWGKDTLYFDEEDKKWFRVMGGLSVGSGESARGRKVQCRPKAFLYDPFPLLVHHDGDGNFHVVPDLPPGVDPLALCLARPRYCCPGRVFGHPFLLRDLRESGNLPGYGSRIRDQGMGEKAPGQMAKGRRSRQTVSLKKLK